MSVVPASLHTEAALPRYDLTARKAHQWAMVALVAAGFVAGDRVGTWLLVVAGLIMLLGRFWWPADVVRQFVWRVAEPVGWLRRRDAHEDRATRRIARIIGGLAWLVAAGLLAAGVGTAAWTLALLITAMVVLDASVDFCALCFAVAQLDRRRLLPAALAHRPEQACFDER